MKNDFPAFPAGQRRPALTPACCQWQPIVIAAAGPLAAPSEVATAGGEASSITLIAGAGAAATPLPPTP